MKEVCMRDKCGFVSDLNLHTAGFAVCSIHRAIVRTTQSNFFAAGCKIMQHYVTNLYNIVQHYVIRGDISPHFRRLIAVNDRFCGDNLIRI